MSKPGLSALLVAGLTLAACGEQQDPPAEPQFANVEVRMNGSTPRNYHTHATGAEEVPARDTRAQGQLKLQLSKDGESLSYKLIVANIQNVTQAHLHMELAGNNGPVVVWLYPSGPPAMLIEGRTQGVLGEGVITAASLVGPLSGQPLSRLLAEIAASNIYVNVHTSQFPPGEIRGQVQTGG